MDTKTELVAMAIRALSTKTNLIRKPDALEDVAAAIFGTDTYDVRLAKDVIAEAERVIKIAKRVRTNLKFKKITKNI